MTWVPVKALPLVSCVTLGQSLNLSETQYFYARSSVAINPPAMQETGSIPGLGRSPGEGIGYPLQYSCLENTTDRGAWHATVHGVTESDMTERLSTHARMKKSQDSCEGDTGQNLPKYLVEKQSSLVFILSSSVNKHNSVY